jgi:hypothetical protein
MRSITAVFIFVPKSALTTGPQNLPTRDLHTVRYSAFHFDFLKASSSCSHLPSPLRVTSNLVSILPSVTCLRCFRRQFLLKKGPG